jgi:hypothetical protein
MRHLLVQTGVNLVECQMSGERSEKLNKVAARRVMWFFGEHQVRLICSARPTESASICFSLKARGDYYYLSLSLSLPAASADATGRAHKCALEPHCVDATADAALLHQQV